MKRFLRFCFVPAKALLFIYLFAGCSSDDNSTGSNTPVVPVLTTTAVSAITPTTAQSGGNITSDGGADVTARGVCWSLTATPTIDDDKTTDGTGTGSYTSTLSGLMATTPYYVTAYATNSVGTGYGTARLFTTSGTVTDFDGNVYQTIAIGTQVWMAENLKVTHYRNGDPISNVTDNGAWEGLSSGAYCDYDNSADTADVYGRLYNWYAVDDSRSIAPTGWHVPTDEEWKQLEIYLGMNEANADLSGYRGTDEGGKLKETGTAHWLDPNTGATDEYDFAALPGGYRVIYGDFLNIGVIGFFWTSTEYATNVALYRSLDNANSSIYRGDYTMKGGFSVRCIKD